MQPLIEIYHITDLGNLPAILIAGGLYSSAYLENRHPEVIGYPHIKEERLHRFKVPCCGNRFVGEFVPFYFCVKSPMLRAISQGHTGRSSSSQRRIIYLVSTLEIATNLNREWAISSRNAGSKFALFSIDKQAVEWLDWKAIRAPVCYSQWKISAKAAEFLIADFFPWSGFTKIGCYDGSVASEVRSRIQAEHPKILVRRDWYY